MHAKVTLTSWSVRAECSFSKVFKQVTTQDIRYDRYDCEKSYISPRRN